MTIPPAREKEMKEKAESVFKRVFCYAQSQNIEHVPGGLAQDRILELTTALSEAYQAGAADQREKDAGIAEFVEASNSIFGEMVSEARFKAKAAKEIVDMIREGE
jgi:hypothetical protein